MPAENNQQRAIELTDLQTAETATNTSTIDEKTESITSFIQRKIAQLKISEPHSWSTIFFTNLRLRLPGKEGRAQKALYEGEDLMDELLYDSADSSELMRSKSIRGFYADVAKAVEENYVDMKRVDELLEKIKHSHTSSFDETQLKEHTQELEELFTLLEPAYVGLRNMGYNHYDITGMLE